MEIETGKKRGGEFVGSFNVSLVSSASGSKGSICSWESFSLRGLALLRSAVLWPVSRQYCQGSRLSLAASGFHPTSLVVPGKEKPCPESPGMNREGAWPGMCFSDWLLWVKLSALEPGGGAIPPGDSELENKGSVDPQNIMGVLIPEEEVGAAGLTKQQTSTTQASVRFS